MNLVGKIFVVLVLVLSLVFMAMAVAVYATHRNWRDMVLRPVEVDGKPKGLKLQLSEAQAEVRKKDANWQQTLNELANAKSARDRERAGLISQLEVATTKSVRLEANEATLTQEKTTAVTSMEATQNSISKLRTEIEVMRTALDTARQERDGSFVQVRELEDKFAQADTESKRFRSQNEQLIAENNRYRLRFQDLKVALDSTGPPRLDGLVLAVNANDYLEISVGSDDGLEKGHELDVYRLGATVPENKYLGRIKIVEAQPDKSVAQVIPNFKRGPIQKDDRVATRLN